MATSRRAWTHQAYFRQFRLSPEQYGEILVAAAFDGTKMGDAQPGYDIEASQPIVRRALRKSGLSLAQVNRVLSLDHGPQLRIEVKSKLARTPAGRANVIHCRNKLTGARGQAATTHFAVILFDGNLTGLAEEAWLFTHQSARRLQRPETKSGYIPVPAVRRAGKDGNMGVVVIRTIINAAAVAPLSLSDR